jgi:hypothetical protein
MFSQTIINRTAQAANAVKGMRMSVICGQAYQMNATDWSVDRHSSVKFTRETAVHQDSEGVV